MDSANAVLRQCLKPSGWLGRLNLRRMNSGHSKLTDWGLARVQIGKQFTILDIGCGGGRTIRKLAALASEGKVFGVDHSEDSVALSRKANREEVAAGRVNIQQSSVSKLPFEDRMFDLVIGVETHYYWPDIISDLREVQRVLKPAGTLLLIAEAYAGGKYDKRLAKFAELLKEMNSSLMTVAEHREVLEKARYTDVQVLEDYEKGWLCALGKRPA